MGQRKPAVRWVLQFALSYSTIILRKNMLKKSIEASSQISHEEDMDKYTFAVEKDKFTRFVSRTGTKQMVKCAVQMTQFGNCRMAQPSSLLTYGGPLMPSSAVLRPISDRQMKSSHVSSIH